MYALAMVLLALPSFYGLVRWLGLLSASRVILALSLLAYLIETIAIKTGFPYGTFVYGSLLGSKLFGVTPWTVPFGWIPLLIGVWSLVYSLAAPIKRLSLGVALLLLVDMVIDPFAVRAGFWRYLPAGIFFGVPLSNFAGWILSGTLGLTIILLSARPTRSPTSQEHYWMRSTLVMTLISAAAYLLLF